MRPASSCALTVRITVLCLLATLFSFDGLASAQDAATSKHKLSQQTLASPRPVGAAAARKATHGAPPPLTTDNWTGSGGDNNWGTSTNWSAGVPTSSDAVTIGTTTANVTLNVAGAAGTLTLSNVGDTLSFTNNEALTMSGNITNNGSITMNSVGNSTDLIIGVASATLSGTGTLTMGNNSSNRIYGSVGTDTFTNASTIQGSGQIGADQLTLVNSGTINATNSATVLTLETSGGTTNTGTLEATTGTLVLAGNTITQTGSGNINSTGSDVQLTDGVTGGVTINGGTLKTSGTGLIHATSGQTATLENLTNSGNFQLDNNSLVNLVGTITNNGNINFASVGNNTDLVMSGNVTLSGTGTLTLSNNTQNRIYGAVASDVLTVGSGQTISGAGQIGVDQMGLVNNGIIDANQPSTLTIWTSGGTTNTKTLEATSGGTLVLQGEPSTTLTNTGGTITAATGSTVTLDNGIVINGGTISSSGTGLLHTLNSSTLENLTITGTYQQDNNSITTLVGTITDDGNINLVSVGNVADLALSGNVTLRGSGTLTMSANTQNRIYGVSGAGTEVLTNNINISGAGQIGLGQTIIDNTSLGTINANQSAASLTIDPSAGGVTNTGLLEATSGGTLVLQSGTYTNAVGSTSGTILANGGTVNLSSSVDIVGGTLKSQNSGLIQVINTATLDGSTSTGAVTLVAGSALTVQNNTALSVKGSIVNNGTLTLNSGGNTTEFEVIGTATASSATLSGTGTLVMSNNTQNFIFGEFANSVFTNQETIQGSGVIGDGQMVFVNNGTVNANQTNTLTINPSGGTTNTGILEATTTGTLLLSGSTITNTGATIQAIGASGVGNGAVVNLQSGVNITGGTITSNSFGSFNVLNTATLTGLTNTGTVNVENNTALTLVGTIVNNGTINSNSVGNVTEILLSGNVALNGTGTINLSNNTQNYIFGGVSADVLTVASTQTIQGAGFIGDGQMTLVNNGVIDANVSNVLTLNASGGTTNTKTIEATNGGTLLLSSGPVTNTGAGTIVAGSGSTVNLSSVTVTGGSLTGSGTFVNVANSTLSGLTNSSTIQVTNNTQMFLTGTIVNNGQMQENSVGNVTEILLNGNVTLSGTGTLTLTDNSQNYIFGLAGTDVLTNAQTIQGAGQIGDGQMGLVNSGTIDATGTNPLIINVSGTVNNTGTFEATNSGGLTVTAPTGNFLNYSSGTNTLTGGKFIANGGNIILPLGTSGGIATLAASVTEEGGSQILNSNNGNANALNGLTSITSAGSLTIGGVTFTDAGAFSNAGSLTILTGETFTVGSLTQISGNTLTAGTYVLDANLNLSGAAQNITTNAANVTLAGGTIHNNTGNSNALANLAANTGKLTIAGATNSFTTVGNFSNTGTLTLNAPGDTFTVTGTLAQISGSTLSGGTFVLGGNLNVASGINITTNSSTLTLDGGTIESGASNALLNLATNTRSLTLAGNANFTTTGNFTNTGALTVNSGSTFTVLHTKSLTNYHNTGASANTLIGGSYTVAGTLAFDAGTTGAIKTDSANITLEGGGNFLNTSTGAPSTNALLNLATISSTGSFTLAQNANFTTVGGFTNSGKLTVNSGSTFTATGLLSNLASGTLTGGTFTVGGTLQLTSGNGGITTNAAKLTLTGTSAKIMDGTSNALAGFNNNTGAFTLTGGATLSSAGSFTNAGTVDIAKGSTLTVPGTGHTYSQSATTAQTTIDGTLTGINGGAIINGGTILGAGTIRGNVSAGNASGNAVTINVGDNAKAGLLSITGTYTQLATGNMTGLINGTTAGSGFSQMKVTGAAALAGTINFTVAAAFQSSLTLNETFTVLTASSVTGTFSNSTIAINGTFHFNVSYTATGVVLTVASGPVGAPSSSPAPSSMASIALSGAKPAATTTTTTTKGRTPIAVSGLRHGVSGASRATRPMMVASWAQPTGHSNAIVAGGSGWMSVRSWERIPVISTSQTRPIMVTPSRTVAADSTGVTLPTSNLRMGQSHMIAVQSPAAGWMGSGARRVPVKSLSPMLPRIGR